MESRVYPELKEIVAEASQALAHLNADRLEEMALSCDVLNRGLGPMKVEERMRLERESLDAFRDMAIFARVVELTRVNLNVMYRLRELRARQPQNCYRAGREWLKTEVAHGDN